MSGTVDSLIQGADMNIKAIALVAAAVWAGHAQADEAKRVVIERVYARNLQVEAVAPASDAMARSASSAYRAAISGVPWRWGPR